MKARGNSEGRTEVKTHLTAQTTDLRLPTQEIHLIFQEEAGQGLRHSSLAMLRAEPLLQIRFLDPLCNPVTVHFPSEAASLFFNPQIPFPRGGANTLTISEVEQLGG